MESLQVLEVLVSFLLGNLNLLLELAEGSGVGGLVLLEELEDLLDALGVELNADGVEVLGLVLPEVDLGGGEGVVTVLERVLGVLLKHVLNLLLPVDNSGFEDVGLVFGGGAVAVGHVRWGQRKQGLTLDLADGDVGVSEEGVEFLHKVLADEVGKVHLVEGVVQNGKEDLLASQVEVLKNWFVQLHEDDLVGNTVGESCFFSFWTRLDNKESLSLNFLLWWGLNRELKSFTAELVDEDKAGATLEVGECRSVHVIVLNLGDRFVLDLAHAQVDEGILQDVLVVSQFFLIENCRHLF